MRVTAYRLYKLWLGYYCIVLYMTLIRETAYLDHKTGSLIDRQAQRYTLVLTDKR